jgi:transposase
MTKKTTRNQQYSDIRPTLFMAFELGMSEWKLGFTIGLGQKARRRTITAGNLEKVQREIVAAKKRFQLPETAEVVSCYEAGRDGFWLHRYLTQSGIGNLVVDSASIEVNRRKRRAKTDRLDVEKLLTMLIRY